MTDDFGWATFQKQSSLSKNQARKSYKKNVVSHLDRDKIESNFWVHLLGSRGATRTPSLRSSKTSWKLISLSNYFKFHSHQKRFGSGHQKAPTNTQSPIFPANKATKVPNWMASNAESTISRRCKKKISCARLCTWDNVVLSNSLGYTVPYGPASGFIWIQAGPKGMMVLVYRQVGGAFQSSYRGRSCGNLGFPVHSSWNRSKRCSSVNSIQNIFIHVLPSADMSSTHFDVFSHISHLLCTPKHK